MCNGKWLSNNSIFHSTNLQSNLINISFIFHISWLPSSFIINKSSHSRLSHFLNVLFPIRNAIYSRTNITKKKKEKSRQQIAWIHEYFIIVEFESEILNNRSKTVTFLFSLFVVVVRILNYWLTQPDYCIILLQICPRCQHQLFKTSLIHFILSQTFFLLFASL